MMSGGELAAAVGEAVDPTSLLQRVTERTLELIPAAEGVAIGLINEQAITYVSGAGTGASPVGATVAIDASLSGLAIQTGTILRSNDTQSDPRVDTAACQRLGVVSLVCIPLSRAHEMFGVLAVNASATHAFSDADVAVLARLADFVSVAVGSACDLHRASNQLLEFSRPSDLADEASDPAVDTTGRFVMNVLNPDTVARLDAHLRVQQVLGDPDRLSILLQPIVDLFSGEIVAVEALARFDITPVRPPDMWFDDATLAGLGVQLELLAITQALAHHAMIPEGIALTINVGPETIVSPHLREALLDIPARRVVLELTEHTAFDNYPSLPGELMALRRGGVRLAVDDAGSGYSSLTHILNLAPDFIKLDRELICGIDLDPVRRALVTSLVTFAADTGAEILAEGVETRDELDVVRRLGVRYAQGYYLGRPAPLHELLNRPAPLSAPPGRLT